MAARRKQQRSRRPRARASVKAARALSRVAYSTGIWTGTLSFSLVAIPVELVTAVRPGRVSFRMLHKKDNSPLQRRMYCPKDQTTVPPEDMVRGYTVGPNKYMPVTDRELESVTPERSRTIEITQFIDLDEVDTIYFVHPYYLIPARGGEKAYCLLAEVMERAHKAALAKFVLGEREYLVAVKSTDGALSLLLLHYSEEILSYDDIAPAASKAGNKTDSREKARVAAIIKGMVRGFRPEKYADERRSQILALLKAKARHKAAVESPPIEEEEPEGPADLVAALEESMRKVKGAE